MPRQMDHSRSRPIPVDRASERRHTADVGRHAGNLVIGFAKGLLLSRVFGAPDDRILLLDAYTKNKKSDLSKDELKQIKKEIV